MTLPPNLLVSMCDGVDGEVTLADATFAPQAEAALAPLCADGEATTDGSIVKFPIRHRAGAIVDAVRRLDEAGVEVDDVAVRRPTLDDVFLTLTGHAAEDAAEKEEEAA